MELNLLFHNIGFASGTVIALIIGVFVYIRDRKAIPNITFALSFLSIAIFCGSHVIGVNISDPNLSRAVLMGNVSVIWIACFLAHCAFAVAGALQKQKIFLISMYTCATLLSLIFIIFPETYLLPSIPKMYFPNYYVPGTLQWIMRLVFNLFVPVYIIAYLIYVYRTAESALQNRLKYFFTALIVGYGVGSIANFLVYDIQIDPMWASFCVPIFALPLVYAIVRYNLIDIRIVAKRAFTFGVIVACASFGIFLIGFVNTSLLMHFPNFPGWILPFIGGLIASILGVVVWNNFRQADQLKYEFITTITHKLRTPLTAIKWSSENIVPLIPVEAKPDMDRIKEGSQKLMQMVDVIIHASSEDNAGYLYRWQELELNIFCKQIVKEYRMKAQTKSITITFTADGADRKIRGDKIRLQSVMQIILDNALAYSLDKGHVHVSVHDDGKLATITVVDDGIGIDKNALPHIFSRFYRSDRARTADTEGLGIGLFLAKEIVEHHKGKIKVISDGVKGSSFSVSIPLIH